MSIPSLSPPMTVEGYFDRTVTAFGLVEDRWRHVRRRFQVEITGYPDGDVFILDEHFLFDDGEKTHRIWRIRRLADGSYEGMADDVKGRAHGRASGPGLTWAYKLWLPIAGRTWLVGFDDRMYLGPDGVLLNIARMHKWGLTLGRIIIAFRPKDAE